MENKLINFNRRGMICAINKTCQEQNLTSEEAVICRTVAGLDARYFVVMKRIDDRHMLVAPVFGKKRRNCRTIGINGRQFWVNFMTFYVVPEQAMEAAPGKYLDNSYKSISAIYTSHNNVLNEKWRREKEERMMDQELRRLARERKYKKHRYNMDRYEIPEYIRQRAMHPYSGGLVRSR